MSEFRIRDFFISRIRIQKSQIGQNLFIFEQNFYNILGEMLNFFLMFKDLSI